MYQQPPYEPQPPNGPPWQQPPTQYPQQWQPPPYYQQPYYPPPIIVQQSPPPKKKFPTWAWILLDVAVVLVCGFCGLGYVVSRVYPAPTPASIQATQVSNQQQVTGTWTTVQTFKGNGEKKTAIFTVPGDWKIVYTCRGYADGVDGSVSVTVYSGDDNSYIDLAVFETCPAGKITRNESEEHQGGNVYLDISGSGDGWTVEVQTLQ